MVDVHLHLHIYIYVLYIPYRRPLTLTPNPEQDINQDGVVTLAEFTAWYLRWVSSNTSSSARLVTVVLGCE